VETREICVAAPVGVAEREVTEGRRDATRDTGTVSPPPLEAPDTARNWGVDEGADTCVCELTRLWEATDLWVSGATCRPVIIEPSGGFFTSVCCVSDRPPVEVTWVTVTPALGVVTPEVSATLATICEPPAVAPPGGVDTRMG